MTKKKRHAGLTLWTPHIITHPLLEKGTARSKVFIRLKIDYWQKRREAHAISTCLSNEETGFLGNAEKYDLKGQQVGRV
jgi:hypothetical protein